MSHFLVGVIISKTNDVEKAVEKLLEPFNENTVMPRYVKYTKTELIAYERKNLEQYKNGQYAKYLKDPKAYIEQSKNNEGHLKYITKEFPAKLKWTDEQVYNDAVKWYEKDEIGKNGEVYSTYNPQSKWDWWRIGGRWDGLVSTDSKRRESKDQGFNFSDEHEQLHNNVVIVSKLPRLKDNVPFALLTPDGKWHEKGDMGWWGMVKDEKKQDAWNQAVWDILDKYPDHLLVGIDCHI